MSQFCYLGDGIGQTGGCVDAVTLRIRSAWKAFHDHLPLLTNRGISFADRGNLFDTCVHSVLVHAGETWPLSKDDLSRKKRIDHAMIRWICGVRLDQQHATDDLLQKLHIDHVEEVHIQTEALWSSVQTRGQYMDKEDNEL